MPAPVHQTFERSPQALFQFDVGLPVQDLARPRDVRLPDLGIVDRQGLEDDLALRARDPDDGLGQVEQGHLMRVPEVDRKVLLALDEQVEAPARDRRRSRRSESGSRRRRR